MPTLAGRLTVVALLATSGCGPPGRFAMFNAPSPYGADGDCPDGWPVVRTDFSDDAAWTALCDRLRRPVSDAGFEFYSCLKFIDDRSIVGETEAETVANLTDRDWHDHVILADARTFAGDERTLRVGLLTDSLAADPKFASDPATFPRWFRAVPGKIQEIENNLSIANCDWEDFADHVDPDGVYRGLPGE